MRMRASWELFRTEMRRIAEIDGAMEDSFSIEDLDSLARAEVIVAVESEFGIQLTNDEILCRMKTYGDLKSVIKGKIIG